jgi:glycosyltransferase involved in cell wall biosynthesis
MTGESAFRLTALHRVWRLLPPRQRRRLVTGLTALVAPRIPRPVPPARGGVAVAGELSRASGLGENARLMLLGLQHLGVPHWPIDVGGLLPGASADLPAAAGEDPPPGAPLVLHVNPPLLPLTLLRLRRGLGRGRRVIGYWSWELPIAPPEWRVGARFVHEVWALTPFVAEALEPLLPGKVRVVPPPLAIAPPRPSALGRSAFGLHDDAVVVLVSFNLASSFERKNPLAAIAAFRAAFGDRTDRLLLLKVGNRSHFPGDFARIAAVAALAPNIRLETRVLPTADLHALTVACDIVLSLHRSEGFGLVPAEAMLLGKPVIATGWSGNMAFMDASNAALVGYRLVPAEDSRDVYAGASWAEPDQADAVAHLRRLADDAEARRDLGGRGREAAFARLGVAPLAAALRDIGLPVPGAAAAGPLRADIPVSGPSISGPSGPGPPMPETTDRGPSVSRMPGLGTLAPGARSLRTLVAGSPAPGAPVLGSRA